MEVGQPSQSTPELPRSSLPADLYSCLLSKSLSDVTFVVKDQVFSAHKLILACRSKYFENLLAGRQGSVEVEIQNASPDIFRVIIEYMYTDLAFLDLSNVWGVHTAGQYYNLEGLTAKCVAFLIDAVDANNVFEVWKCAQGANIQPVIDYCVHFISKTFNTLLSNNGANLQDQQPEQVQRHVTEQIQQNRNSGNFDDTNRMMRAMQKYKFPSAEHLSSQEDQSILNLPPTHPESTQAPQQQFKSQDEGDEQDHDFPSWTQTFELLGDIDMPPAAVPTAESLSAFPEFFFDSQQHDSRPDQAQQGQVPPDNSNAKDQAQSSADKPAEGSKPVHRRGSLLTRRLSLVSDPSNLGVVFQYVISCVTRLMDADRTTLFLYDRNTDELCSQVAIGDCEIRIPSDKGIAGSVFQSGKSVNVKDAYSDAKFNANVDKSTGYNTRCVLCSPIISKKTGNIVGVIEVLNKHSGPFDKSDEEHMNTVAALFAILVDDPDITKMSRVLVPPTPQPLPLDFDISSFLDNQLTEYELPDWQSLFQGVHNGNDNPTGTDSDNNVNMNPNFPLDNMEPFPQAPPQNTVPASQGFDPTGNSLSSPMPSSAASTPNPEQHIYTQFSKPQQDRKAVQKLRRTGTPSATAQGSKRGKKRKRDNAPFMHFRIPRYELQFIPYSGGQGNSEPKTTNN